MILGFLTSVFNGLSGPQVWAARILGGGLVVGVVALSIRSYGSNKFDEGVLSRAQVVRDLQEKYATAESERLRLSALYSSCQTNVIKQSSHIQALTEQNETAALKAADAMLEMSRINARAVADAAKRSEGNKDYEAALDKKLKGLRNECDANGKAIVPNGANVLRDVIRRQ